MKIKYWRISILVIAILAFGAVALGNSTQGKGNDKVRVITHSDKEVSGALSEGCKVVREARTLKALVCPENIATSLGLQEDVQVFAMDSGANTQIKADLVQTAGNTGQGRKVVILDTGYNYTHPELSSSYIPEGYDFVNKDNDPFDDNGHGTHVAGIMTADGLNPKAKGVAPDTGIIAGKVLDASGSGYFSDVVAAIYWAVDGPDGIANTSDDFNADAISMSLGTGAPYLYKGFCDNALPDLTNAIKYALNRGVIVVVAAGNSGNSGVSIPGCISYSTTVGAVDSSDKIASFSSKGNAVDITAPGVSIYSSWLGNSYATASGTSMATPMVSGVVALIKYAHPEYTVSQVQNALFKTVKDLGTIGFDTSYGWGRVDALAAVGNTTYSATFSQSGIPSGTTWGVIVGGTRYTSMASDVSVSGLIGTVVYSYDSTVSGTNGTRYVCSTGCSGTVTLTDNNKTATYKTQYRLTMKVSPAGSGITSPAIGSYWYDSGSPAVSISAKANSGYVFSSWSGSGTGSYTGTANSATITMNSPITQTANFVKVAKGHTHI